jgi:hypothetical protein
LRLWPIDEESFVMDSDADYVSVLPSNGITMRADVGSRPTSRGSARQPAAALNPRSPPVVRAESGRPQASRCSGRRRPTRSRLRGRRSSIEARVQPRRPAGRVRHGDAVRLRWMVPERRLRSWQGVWARVIRRRGIVVAKWEATWGRRRTSERATEKGPTRVAATETQTKAARAAPDDREKPKRGHELAEELRLPVERAARAETAPLQAPVLAR